MEQTQYERALAFAKKKHEGQFRMGGEKYITHPVAVSEILKSWGYDLPLRIAALFHDLLEDTDATCEEIEALGSPEILEIVRLVTKEKGYRMEDYVSRIRNSPGARAVKAADRLHNLRTAFLAPEEFKRRYIEETREWFLDFHPDIPEAVNALEASLKGEADAKE